MKGNTTIPEAVILRRPPGSSFIALLVKWFVRLWVMSVLLPLMYCIILGIAVIAYFLLVIVFDLQALLLILITW